MSILIVWTLAVFSQVSAQGPFLLSYGGESELPSATVYFVFQDSDGYIWACTDAGLSRFDGYSFKNFTTNDGLPSNEIMRVYEDSRGLLWILTLNGKPGIYYEGKIYSEFNFPPLKKVNFNSLLLYFHEGSDGSIYLTSYRNGYVRIHPDGKTIRYPESSSRNTIGMREYGQKMFVFYQDHVIEKGIDTPPGEEEYIRGRYTLNKNYGRIAEFGENAYLVLEDTIFQFNYRTSRIENRFLVPEIPNTLFAGLDRSGHLWLGTTDGAFEYYFSGPDSLVLLGHYLKGKYVSSVLEDREGNFWFSTLYNGILFSSAYQILRVLPGDAEPGFMLSCLEKDGEGKVWAGGAKGEYYIQGDSDWVQHQIPSDPHRQVKAICREGDNSMWVCSKSGIIQHKDGRTRALPYLANDLIRDSRGDYWFGGIYLFRADADYLNPIFSSVANLPGEFMRSVGPEMDTIRVLNKRINTIEEDKEGQIWVGGPFGIDIIDPISLKTKSLTGPEMVYRSEIAEIKSIPQSPGVWVAGKGSGVVQFIGDSIARTFTVKDGLSGDICSDLEMDREGNIWVGSNLGLDLIVISGKEDTILNITRMMGYSNLTVNDLLLDTHLVYLATDRGLITIPIDPAQMQVAPPPIFLDEILVNGKTRSFQENEELRYYQNVVTFRFTGLSYKDAGEITYQYRLNGLHNQWYKTNARELTFDPLPSGEYTFEVRALNSFGIPSAQAAKIGFIVLAPFWKKAWFILLILLALFLLVFAFVAIRIQNLKRRYQFEQNALILEKETAEAEKKAAEMSHLALRSQMNPHFIFNTLNTIKGFYAEGNAREAGNYINRFAKLMRRILASSSSFHSLEKEIEILRLYLELMEVRYEHKFSFGIETTGNIQPDALNYPAMLLQPIVENAVIHGMAPLEAGGELNIHILREGGYLIARIRDNGVGREAAKATSLKKEKGFSALGAIEERMEILGEGLDLPPKMQIRDLKNEPGKATGTEVTIWFPVVEPPK